jgi:hypothetical protein
MTLVISPYIRYDIAAANNMHVVEHEYVDKERRNELEGRRLAANRWRQENVSS